MNRDVNFSLSPLDFEDNLGNFKLDNDTFARHPKKAHSDYKDIPGKDEYVLKMDNEIISYFILDNSHEFMPVKESRNDKPVLLRCFSVDERYQGKGFGRKTMEMLLDKLEKETPNDSLILVAEIENYKAVNLYSSMGFTDTGKRMTGFAGAQMLMKRKIIK